MGIEPQTGPGLRTARGRGTARNPGNRFERLSWEPGGETAEDPSPATEFLRDRSRSIIAYNDSPDVGFDASVNPYRGCEHGCVYCFARPNHEYLGFSAGLDFESRILVKEDAPELLARELGSPRWRPQPLAMSGVTDPYQPVERRLGLTRRCLEVLARFRNPVVIITKNDLVSRDRDLLARMAAWKGSVVHISITTLDPELASAMEPRAVTPARRLSAIRALAQAGVPVGVLTAPVIPGLTDHELPSILDAAAGAGAAFAGYVALRLPYGVGELFDEWLAVHRPERRSKILGRIESVRGGRRNDPRFVSRMRGEGADAAEIRDLFAMGCRRAGLNRTRPELDASGFDRTGGRQPSLFEGPDPS